jgi:hypothetical protein
MGHANPLIKLDNLLIYYKYKSTVDIIINRDITVQAHKFYCSPRIGTVEIITMLRAQTFWGSVGPPHSKISFEQKL